jgi:O-glycosyl hydrolase
MKNLNIKNLVLLFVCLWLVESCTLNNKADVSKSFSVNASHTLQTCEGFGVNITPNQWRNGNLKPTLNLLVDDLGATLFRFDCTGLANWLDPAKRQKDGTWPTNYLDSVYRSKTFTDAWD